MPATVCFMTLTGQGSLPPQPPLEAAFVAAGGQATRKNLWYSTGRSLRLEPMDGQGINTLGAYI